MESGEHQGAFFFGLIIGAIAGALAALLLAPKPGHQMRHELKDQVGGVQQLITDTTTNVRDRSEGVMGTYVDKAMRISQRRHDHEDVVVAVETPAGTAAAVVPEPPTVVDGPKEEPTDKPS